MSEELFVGCCNETKIIARGLIIIEKLSEGAVFSLSMNLKTIYRQVVKES